MTSLIPWARRWAACLACLGAAGASLAAAPQTEAPADLVLRRGQIYTLDTRQPWAQAVAVRQGRFVAVGSEAQVARLIGPRTQVLDLQGRMVVPGLHDVHAHPIEGAYEALYSCAIPPKGQLAEVLAAVSACAARAEPGDWIVGGPWFSGLLPELSKAESLAALDRASRGMPVVLRDDSFHHRWVSSAVLKLAGIGPGSVAPAGGTYVMADGQPTGLVLEPPAWGAINQMIPPRPPERLLKAANSAAQTLNAFGITGVQDAYVSREVLQSWQRADAQPGGLPLRVVTSLAQDNADPAIVVPPRSAEAEQARSERLRPDYAKLFLDGVPMAFTAAMLAPYLPSPMHNHGHDFKGEALYSLPDLVKRLAAWDKQGVPVKLHSVGDGAVRLALDAVEQVRRLNGPNGPQHQIAHITFVDPQDMPRFAALNVVADVSPMLWFPHSYTPLFELTVGRERSERSYPIGSLVKAGALVAGGSDWPAGQQTANPWIGIEGLVTRRNPLGEMPGVLNPAERLSLDQALRIYSLNSARAMGLGAQAGSIEVGKSADWVVLNQPLFQIPPERIHQTQALETWFQGRRVYSAPAAQPAKAAQQ